MNTLKATIKTASAEQVDFKQQRKTVHFEGDRKLSPAEAVEKHAWNRKKLRLLFIAYAILRGKDPVVAVSNYDPKDPFQVKAVQKYVDEHKSYFEERRAKWEAESALRSSQQQA